MELIVNSGLYNLSICFVFSVYGSEAPIDSCVFLIGYSRVTFLFLEPRCICKDAETEKYDLGRNPGGWGLLSAPATTQSYTVQYTTLSLGVSSTRPGQVTHSPGGTFLAPSECWPNIWNLSSQAPLKYKFFQTFMVFARNDQRRCFILGISFSFLVNSSNCETKKNKWAHIYHFVLASSLGIISSILVLSPGFSLLRSWTSSFSLVSFSLNFPSFPCTLQSSSCSWIF